jgi:hypothetical protein
MENNMTKRILSIASLLTLFAGIAFGQQGGTNLTQTTLASAQYGGQQAGQSLNYQTTVNLASATGVQAANNGQPITWLYVGGEVEGVLTLVTGQTTIYNVLRGQFGTKIGSHPSGDMVLLYVSTPQFGGNSGSGGLQQTDPPVNGLCYSASSPIFGPPLVQQWLNVLTGAQWLCSTITNTWVPSWDNPLAGQSPKSTTTVASAAGLITPSGPLFEVSGTAAITGFNIPVGFNATAFGGGKFCINPTGTFTTTTANNIAKASTAVVGQLLCYTWDATDSKFIPSY